MCSDWNLLISWTIFMNTLNKIVPITIFQLKQDVQSGEE